MLPASITNCLHAGLLANQAPRLAQLAQRAFGSDTAVAQDWNQGAAASYGSPAGQQQQQQQQQQDDHYVIPILDRFDQAHNNTFFITGKVARHPTLRVDRFGRSWADLEIVKNKRIRNDQGELVRAPSGDFYTFSARGALARAINDQIRKGQYVTVEGFVNVFQPPAQGSMQDQFMAGQEVGKNQRLYRFVARHIALINKPEFRGVDQQHGHDMGGSQAADGQ